MIYIKFTVDSRLKKLYLQIKIFITRGTSIY